MFRFFCFWLFALVGSLSGVNQGWGATVLWENDFQSGVDDIYRSSALGLEWVDDPSGLVGNKVGRIIDIGGVIGSTQWGEIRPLPKHGLALDGVATPGVDQFTMTVRYYIPSDTTGGSEDRLSLIFRWGTDPDSNPGVNVNGSSSLVYFNTVKDTWQTLTYTGTIHSSATYLFPIISIADNSTYGVVNETFLYLDDISFTVTPEPGRVLLLMGAFGVMLLRRGRGSWV